MNLKFILLISLISAILFITPAVFSGGTDLTRIGIGIVVIPGGGQSGSAYVGPGTCASNMTSCGSYPLCYDLTNVTYCSYGHVVTTYCLMNIITSRSTGQTCNTTGLLGGYAFQLNVTNGRGEGKQINMKLFRAGSQSLLSGGTISTNGSVASPFGLADMQFDFDNQNLNVVINGLNVSQLANSESEIVLDKPPVAINGIFVYRVYHVKLPSNFIYSNITISFQYGDTAAINDNNLKFYRCGDFNTDTNSCNTNWEILTPTTIDSGHKIISLNINGFSVYALGEQAPQGSITTTTTTSTTTTSSTATTTPSQSTTTTTQYYYSSDTGSSSGSSGSGQSGSSISTPRTTTATTVSSPSPNATSTTNNTAAANASSNGLQNITGFSFAGVNPYFVVIPIASAAGYFAWRYYLIGKYPQPSGRIVVYHRANGKTLRRIKRGRDTQLVLS
jgi:hypothetical protein